jgi:hypothetical protein
VYKQENTGDQSLCIHVKQVNLSLETAAAAATAGAQVLDSNATCVQCICIVFQPFGSV